MNISFFLKKNMNIIITLVIIIGFSLFFYYQYFEVDNNNTLTDMFSDEPSCTSTSTTSTCNNNNNNNNNDGSVVLPVKLEVQAATNNSEQCNNTSSSTSTSTSNDETNQPDNTDTTGEIMAVVDEDKNKCPGSSLDGKNVTLKNEEDIENGNKEVFNIKNNIFSYYDADRVCKAFGAELATFDQVHDAYKKGGNWCNYGWTQGQLALYPTQYSEWKKRQEGKGTADQKNECGRPGINGGYFDNPHLKFGVNCYGVKDEATHNEKSYMNTYSNEITDFKTDEEMKEDAEVNKWLSQIKEGKIHRNSFKCGSWSDVNDEKDNEENNSN